MRNGGGDSAHRNTRRETSTFTIVSLRLSFAGARVGRNAQKSLPRTHSRISTIFIGGKRPTVILPLSAQGRHNETGWLACSTPSIRRDTQGRGVQSQTTLKPVAQARRRKATAKRFLAPRVSRSPSARVSTVTWSALDPCLSGAWSGPIQDLAIALAQPGDFHLYSNCRRGSTVTEIKQTWQSYFGVEGVTSLQFDLRLRRVPNVDW